MAEPSSGQRSGSGRARRMVEVYRRRSILHPPGYYSVFDPGHLYLTQRRERAVLDALRRAGVGSLLRMKVLDVGCGRGEWLLRFLSYGCDPSDLCGVELQPELLQFGKRIVPTLNLVQADGSSLPFPSRTFDIVHQATMMTSVLEQGLRRKIAAEMTRVVRPGGLILWFDMRYSNPRNPDIRGIGRRELKELFPGCRIQLRSVSLVPALARRIAPWSLTACRLLEALPPLRIHYLASIRP